MNIVQLLDQVNDGTDVNDVLDHYLVSFVEVEVKSRNKTVPTQVPSHRATRFKQVNEYMLARNVHGYKTRTDLSKKFASAMTGWKTVEAKPTYIKYQKQTKLGWFMFMLKYVEQGLQVGALWPSKLGPSLTGGVLFKKAVRGTKKGNSYEYATIIPVKEGEVVGRNIITAMQTFASILAKAARKVDKYYLETY
jgi:hypothetical protein